VPYTTRLESECIDLEGVKALKDTWIIKPEDGYASKGVYAGVDHGQAQWEELVESCARKPYVVQAYCAQYATPNVLTNPADGLSAAQGLGPWNNLTGLYVYNGSFGGIFSRAGQKGVIVGFAGGVTVPSFLARYDAGAGLALRVRK
jgi:hypothetical protein